MDGSPRVDASTIARRLSTLASFYRYCEQEGLVARSPAVHVRRPKLHSESRTLGLDRTELSAFMIQAAVSTRRDHALASLLALNGLRVSEALNADIENLGAFCVLCGFRRLARGGLVRGRLGRA